MKMRGFIQPIVLLIILTLLSTALPIKGDQILKEKEAVMDSLHIDDSSSKGLIISEPIRIYNNQDLLDFASANSLYGNGSEHDPIIIANYSIDANGKGTGIHIESTDLYCIISGCIISNASGSSNDEDHGIFLKEVSNFIVENTTCFKNDENGITLSYSNHNIIRNNTLYENFKSGVQIYADSQDNEIISNNIYNNDESGVKVSDYWNDPVPRNNRILDNIIEEHRHFYYTNGIAIYRNENCTIRGNSIINNLKGIVITEGIKHLISENEISNDQEDILLLSSYDINISNNILNDSLYIAQKTGNPDPSSGNLINNNLFKGALVLDGSEGNIITNNLFESDESLPIAFLNSINDKVYNNTFYLDSIDSEHGSKTVSSNVWNSGLNTGNFWSIWVTPDANNDGIVDLPFEIPQFNTYDNYPLTDPTINSFADSCHLTYDIVNNAVNLTWAVQDDSDNDLIEEFAVLRAKENNQFKVIAYIPKNLNFFMDTDLEFNINYSYYILMKGCKSVSTHSNIIDLVIEKEYFRPDEPNNISLVEKNGCIILYWDPPANDGGADILHYNIYKNSTDNETIYYNEIDEGTHSFNDTRVINGIQYSYWISANNSVGEGNAAGPFNGTAKGPPFHPINISVDIRVGSLRISWHPPINDGGLPVSSYRIFRNVSSGFHSIGETDLNFFFDEWASPGVNYSYYVVAVNEYGEGVPSGIAWGVSLGVPPPPVPITIGRYDGAIRLNWSLSMNYLSQYETTHIRIYKNNSLLTESPISDVFYNDTDVVNGIEYIYHVSSVNELGEGEKSTDIPATPGWSPSAPRNLRTWTNSTMVIISWDHPEFIRGYPIDGYIIYRQTDDGRWINLMNVPPSNDPHWNDTYVEPGKSYTYKVIALNFRGASPEAGPITATTLQGDPPESPITVSIKLADDMKIEIKWNGPQDDDVEYSIYRKVGEFENFSLLSTTIGLVYYDTPTMENVTYYYYIIASNQYGDSPESQTLSIFIQAHGEDGDGSKSNNSNDKEFPLVQVVIISLIVSVIIIGLIILYTRKKKVPEIQNEQEIPGIAHNIAYEDSNPIEE